MASGADSFSLKGAKDAILISDASAASGVLFRNMSILRNSNFWHGFIIHNVRNYERDEVLKVILDRVFPLDLIPVHYESNNGDALFLARNCAEAVQKLCKDNLIVPNPDISSIPFKLEIYLRFATLANVRIDAQKNVSAVLNQRFCPLTRTLNLNLFHSDPNLSEYSPLSQPKIMYFVLHIANSLQATSIKLCNNGIRTMFPIEALWGSNISSLDLRFNLLDSISQLEPLKLLNISELWLDGNPLCNNYEEYSYVQRIKEMLPKLEKLDGVLLIQNGFPALRRNSLCNLDGHQLVDHFLEYYFTLYDSKNRQMLEGLYHKNAIFSLTTLYKSGQNSSSGCQMQKYQMYARNLRLLADLSKSDQFLFRGNTNIIKLLNRLPSTEHDPYSFTTDLMYYNVTVSGTVCAGVCITGVFREPAENLLDHERVLGFNRTFILEGVNDEFCITNEMLHVYNALNIQENRCFQIAKRLPDVILPPASTPKEKQKLNESFQLIAGLTPEWSRKCLEDADYDLKKAISVFVDLYKVDKIPVVAFKNKEDAGYVANNKPAYTPNATGSPTKYLQVLAQSQRQRCSNAQTDKKLYIPEEMTLSTQFNATGCPNIPEYLTKLSSHETIHNPPQISPLEQKTTTSPVLQCRSSKSLGSKSGPSSNPRPAWKILSRRRKRQKRIKHTQGGDEKQNNKKSRSSKRQRNAKRIDGSIKIEEKPQPFSVMTNSALKQDWNKRFKWTKDDQTRSNLIELKVKTETNP